MTYLKIDIYKGLNKNILLNFLIINKINNRYIFIYYVYIAIEGRIMHF
jgi:hypothetical protein